MDSLNIHNVSFCAKSQLYRNVDSINRRIHLELCDIPSSTMRQLKYDTVYKRYPESTAFEKAYLDTTQKIYDNIRKLRDEFDKQYTLNKDHDYQLLKRLMQKHKGANCRELVEVMKYELDKKGIESTRVGMNIKSRDFKKRRMHDDHIFLLVNPDKNAEIENPTTWGSKAIIVDPWAQVVSYAAEGLQKIELTFGLDKPNEYLKFFKTI